MALLSNSYGDPAEIAALTPKFANSSGVFDETTRPTLAMVESLCDQVSAAINTILATKGFSIPVTQADCVLMLDMFVNEEVASICEGINGYGRFGPTTKKPGKRGRFALILEDVTSFLEVHMVGFERLGAARSFDFGSGIGYRAEDASGDETFPLFQREAFGAKFEDWDS